MDGFYVMYHIQEYVRNYQQLPISSQKSQSHVHKWGKELANASDSDIRLEFYRIQQKVASIICRDVYPTDGMFFGGIPMRLEAEDRLALQRDYRSFPKLGDILIERLPKKTM